MSCVNYQNPIQNISNIDIQKINLSDNQIKSIVHLGASSLSNLEENGFHRRTGYNEDAFVKSAKTYGYEIDYFCLSYYCRILKLYQSKFGQDKYFLPAFKYAILFDDGESGGIVEYHFPNLYQKHKFYGGELRERNSS
jgi:hypothetical protein